MLTATVMSKHRVPARTPTHGVDTHVETALCENNPQRLCTAARLACIAAADARQHSVSCSVSLCRGVLIVH